MKLIDFIYDNSLEIQKSDLRFRDCTDMTGLLKNYHIMHKLFEGNVQVREPYIFKLTKHGKSMLILGTCHTLPLVTYPLNLIQMLGKQNLLFTEKFGYKINYSCSSKSTEVSQTVVETKNYKMPDWFEELTERQQNYIIDLLGIPSIKDCSPYDVREAIVSIQQGIGMDLQIFYFYYMSNRMTYALEDNTKGHESVISLDTSEIFKLLTSIIDLNIASGGGLARPEMINIQYQYLKGDTAISKQDKDNYRVIERNYNWKEKIIETFDKPFMMMGQDLSESILVAVGAAHLIGKESLLDILCTDHQFTVERANLAGEFSVYDLTENY